MSDPSSRLNLIQRAIQREALARKAVKPDRATEENRVTIGSDPTPASQVPDQIPANGAPSIRTEAAPSIRAEAAPSVRAEAAPSARAEAVPSARAEAAPSVRAEATPSVRAEAPSIRAEAAPSNRAEAPSIRAKAAPSVRAEAASLIRAEAVEPRQPPTAQLVRFDAAKLADARISTAEDTHSVTYNEFRALKRKLIPMIADPETGALTRNVVMVTSALPGEGKTFTTVNLAIALAAEPNLSVILVDGDSVRGSIATYFQPSDGGGLLDLLTEKNRSLDEVLHPCADLPRLHVLFSGARHDATPELLASRGMAELCATLSARFPQSIVLFDTPPVLAASEATAMAGHVHHLIMVVAAGRSKRNQVEAALTEVSRCPSMSVVFNRSPEWERPLNDMYSRPYSYASEHLKRA